MEERHADPGQRLVVLAVVVVQVGAVHRAVAKDDDPRVVVAVLHRRLQRLLEPPVLGDDALEPVLEHVVVLLGRERDEPRGPEREGEEEVVPGGGHVEPVAVLVEIAVGSENIDKMTKSHSMIGFRSVEFAQWCFRMP